MAVVIATAVEAKQNLENQQVQEVTGMVVSLEAQGGILDLNTSQGRMAFSVPGDAIILRVSGTGCGHCTLPPTIAAPG